MKSNSTLKYSGSIRDAADHRLVAALSAGDDCQLALLSAHGGARFEGLVQALAGEGITARIWRTVSEVRQWLCANDAVALLYDADFSDWSPEAVERQLGRLLADFPSLRVVALTPRSLALTPGLRALLERGWLHDFHSLPVDLKRLVYCLRHIQGMAALEAQLAERSDAARMGFGHLIGRSEPMRRIYEIVRRVAKIDIPLLLTGESGTGKELIAETIHGRSARRSAQFVAINCAALPPTLIESELFGHEPGAFTGANKRKKGRIEEAHDGTLFLDEIGDMPVDMQPHFLRFLQDGRFKRVGGTGTLRVNTRIVAATNADLKTAMERGLFRDDLFYRLNGVVIEVPPLRSRGSDIELLATYFLKKCCRDYARPRMQFSREALIAIARHPWPGNVRELMSAVARAVALAPRTVIRPVDLGLDGDAVDEARPEGRTLAEARQDFDRKIISNSLARNQHNVQRTAGELGISRVALYRLMKRHGVTRPDQATSTQGGPK